MAAPKIPRRQRAPFCVTVEHAQVTADTTIKFLKLPSDQGRLRITRVDYYNQTGLAADASNTFKVQLKAGSTLIAEWDTTTGQDGAITADTFLSLPLESGATIVDASSVLSLVLDETGTQTLPAGRLTVHGEFI